MKYIVFILLIVIIIFTLYYQQTNYLSFYSVPSNLSFLASNPNIFKVFSNQLSNMNIPFSSFLTANIIFFHLLSDYSELKKIILLQPSIKYCYSLHSINLLASKSLLYKILKTRLSPIELNSITPATYPVELKTEKQSFLRQFDSNKLYIMKKNLQRQSGCHITNKKSEIISKLKEDYVVIQEVLQNPFLINNKKINIRRYLLITVTNTVNFYVYNDGFMYYSKSSYDNSSDKIAVHITTGYIDRSIYDTHPLSYVQFLNSLTRNEANIIEDNMNMLFSLILKAYRYDILNYDNNRLTNFVIMGCDVAVDQNLQCKIMEINKGPDLSFKDNKDKKIKQTLVDDAFRFVINNKPSENFIHIK